MDGLEQWDKEKYPVTLDRLGFPCKNGDSLIKCISNKRNFQQAVGEPGDYYQISKVYHDGARINETYWDERDRKEIAKQLGILDASRVTMYQYSQDY